MPEIRCKWYQMDGTPVRGGCPTPGCRFLHPEQKGWNSLRSPRPYKSPVRCMYFDSHGKPINGGCRSSFRGCRFIHPNDPDWNVAETSRKQVERTSSSPAVSSVPRLTQPDIDERTVALKESRIARPPLPPGALRPGRDSVESHTPALSGSFALKHKSQDPPLTSTDVGAELKHTSHPIPQPSLPSFRYFQMDPPCSSMVSESTSALSKSTDGDVLRQTWKRRISLLAQAHDIIQKLSEIDTDLERRTALQSTAVIPVMVSSAEVNLEALRVSARKKQNILEEKLHTLVTQLIEEDIWPLPSTTQSDFSVERHHLELSAGIAELGWRLDMLVTQLNQIREMDNLHQGIMTFVRGGEEESTLRSSKRRRISATGSFQAPLDLQDILAQLDSLQSKAIELEAEWSYDDRLLEVVDERIEGCLLKKPVAHPAQPDSLKDVVRNLDVDLDVLCGELADLNTSNLVSQIGTLRLETGNLKQTMELLASDQQSLQQRQADLDQQTRKLMEELKELRIMPQGKAENTINSENIIGEVVLDVQNHIDTENALLHNRIKTRHEEIKNDVFAGLEPTILMTETIYNSLRSQTNAS